MPSGEGPCTKKCCGSTIHMTCVDSCVQLPCDDDDDCDGDCCQEGKCKRSSCLPLLLIIGVSVAIFIGIALIFVTVWCSSRRRQHIPQAAVNTQSFTLREIASDQVKKMATPQNVGGNPNPGFSGAEKTP